METHQLHLCGLHPIGRLPVRWTEARTFIKAASGLIFAMVAMTAHAQYAIDWRTIDGGGGSSTGGVYAVGGTIGQPDAGVMSGGAYSLTGGFWSAFVVQTPGAPTLFITNAAPGFATLRWVPATPGFVLQSADSLSATNWMDASSGGTNPVTVTLSGDRKLFRLRD